MKKIKEIIIGTNNNGKYKEICDLLPNEIKNILQKNLKFLVPKKLGKVLKKIHLLKLHIFQKKQV